MPKSEPKDCLTFEDFKKRSKRKTADLQVEYALYKSAVKGVATAQIFYLINRLREDYQKSPEPLQADQMSFIGALATANETIARMTLENE
jgi:hypothetical protein